MVDSDKVTDFLVNMKLVKKPSRPLKVHLWSIDPKLSFHEVVSMQIESLPGYRFSVCLVSPTRKLLAHVFKKPVKFEDIENSIWDDDNMPDGSWARKVPCNLELAKLLTSKFTLEVIQQINEILGCHCVCRYVPSLDKHKHKIKVALKLI